MIFAAVTLLIVLTVLGKRCVRVNREAVSFFEETVPDHGSGIIESMGNTAMPVMEINGRAYTAILEAPAHGVKIAVTASWNRWTVNFAPCRLRGSLYDGTLMIGGTDDEGRFDFIPRTDVGETVHVTDMRGVTYTFRVTSVVHTRSFEPEKAAEKDADLILFAKDKKTRDTVIVYCNMP